MIRKYGWIPDVPDFRDYPFKLRKTKILLPKLVDLRPFCSSVEDQEDIGSCSGNAAAGALEYKDKKNDNKYREVSRLFIYYSAREYIDCINEDSGAYIRDVIRGIAKYGACDEELFPYNTKEFSTKPTDKAYKDALKRRIHSYYRIKDDRVESVKQAVYAGNPVIFGFTIYTGFESEEVANTGKMWVPKPGENAVGGHAVLIVGYNDNIKCFIVRNSWGNSWGDGGYFYMPYEYVANSDLSDDFWVIVDELEFTMINKNNVHYSPDMEIDADWYIPISTIIRAIWRVVTWWRQTPKP